MPLTGVLMIAAMAAIIIGWFWTIGLAFQKSIILGFMCMFWPMAIIFGLLEGKRTRRAAGVGVVGIALGFYSGLFGPLASHL
jgi:hypothetical protein